jgi:mannose/cellobiose epimerase-like protein (N-acyl-D-glucosamine 2-epimerase family)
MEFSIQIVIWRDIQEGMIRMKNRNFFNIITTILSGLLTLTLTACTPSVSTQNNPNEVQIPVNPENQFNIVDVEAVIEALPNGDRWIRHVKEDLLKFWAMDTALGVPLGNFPTYRCNNGALYNAEAPCPELQNADPGIVKLDRDYTRAKSRQVFAYGIAYHLTGNETYLRYAVSGGNWLIEHALDDAGAASWFTEGVAQPSDLQRTSQDMAYAVSGLAFLYYLTRDNQYLDRVIALKKHIFNTYFDPGWGLLRWVREKNMDGDNPDQKELVSQLDQVYGYLLWTTMALPEGELKQAWLNDLHKLASAMRDQFFGETYGLYWGAITDMELRNLANYQNQENPHTDFGHSIKTLWLTYRIGMLTGDPSLVNFARPHMYTILQRAYIPETGSWARGFKPQTENSHTWVLDPNKEWWSLAELDQTSATLALVDPIFARVLPHTYAYWFQHMVDKEHGGIWHMVNAADNQPDLSFPKQHSWKNAFHVFEHALIGYLTAQQLHDEPIVLHYAFRQEVADSEIKPYLYFGEVTEQKPTGAFTADLVKDYIPTAVTFDSLH